MVIRKQYPIPVAPGQGAAAVAKRSQAGDKYLGSQERAKNAGGGRHRFPLHEQQLTILMLRVPEKDERLKLEAWLIYILSTFTFC